MHSGMLATVAALATVPVIALAAQGSVKPPVGSPVTGAKLYLQCRACHTVAKGAAHGVGPNLWGIMGASAASRAGYAYSPAMKLAAIRWTPERMDAFLAKPNGQFPGNKMAFAGVASAAARRDLIAFLSTLREQ